MASPRKKRTLRPDHPDAAVRRGPRTDAGRSRVAQNARRHGLSVPALGYEGVPAEVAALARRICGRGEGTEAGAALPAGVLHLAYRIAEAQIDLVRVRRARHDLVASRLADPTYRTSKGLMGRIAMLKRAGEMIIGGEEVPPDMTRAINDRPRGVAKHALILAELSKELAAMDRYERRARSRRKFAIRAFDQTPAAARCLAARAPDGGDHRPAEPFRRNHFRR